MRIVARSGIPGLTMQAVADRVGCSVGTVYTHFASKGALVADLQNEAILRIASSLQLVRARSDARLEAEGTAPAARAAADLVLFGEFLIACWDAFPEESHLLFSVMAERSEVVPDADLGRVVGSTMVLLAVGREVVQTATDAGVIDDGPVTDRVLVGASALLGVLLTSHVRHLDPVAFDHRRLTRTTWSDLLRGWGMDPSVEAAAQAHVAALADTGPLAPPVDD